jgi:hypothetical protein
MNEEELSYEPIKMLNGCGVQKIITINGRSHKIFVRSCRTAEEAILVANKKNKELKK